MASKNYGDLVEYYKKSLEISTANRDPLRIANNNRYLGDAYISLENYKMAIEYYEKSLEMSTEIDIWL